MTVLARLPVEGVTSVQKADGSWVVGFLFANRALGEDAMRGIAEAFNAWSRAIESGAFGDIVRRYGMSEMNATEMNATRTTTYRGTRIYPNDPRFLYPAGYDDWRV